MHHLSYSSQYIHILIHFLIMCPCTHINHHIPTYHFIRSSSIYHASVFHASMFLNYHIHLPYHTSCNIFYLYTLACINIHILSRSIHYNPFHTTYPIYIPISTCIYITCHLNIQLMTLKHHFTQYTIYSTYMHITHYNHITYHLFKTMLACSRNHHLKCFA